MADTAEMTRRAQIAARGKPYRPRYSQQDVIDFANESGMSKEVTESLLGMDPRKRDQIINMSKETMTQDTSGADLRAIMMAEEPATKKRKGGPIHKKAEMMGGGMYKGKKHSYAGGGMVKDMKLMRSK
jgi:hypothetical protein